MTGQSGIKQGVALMGRNRTGTSCSVSRPTGHAPGPAVADRPCARPARQQRYRRRVDDRRPRAKQYWPIRQASNNTHSELT